MKDAEKKAELEAEMEEIEKMQGMIVNMHPDADTRPEKMQTALESIGKRWNEISDMLRNYKRHGTFEGKELTGSGMTRHDSINTGAR